MKNIKYILLFILPLFAFYSCEDDDASNPPFGDTDLPHIYMEWTENIARKIGEKVEFSPQVSPSDGATYKWTLDGEVIATTKDISFTVNEYMTKELVFEVERNGVTNSRTASLLCPQPFVPKSYSKKSLGFLAKGGGISDVDWDNITHLVLSSVVVNTNDAGTYTLDKTIFDDLNASALVAYAHHNGVYVLLEVSGVLGSYLNAAPVYGSYTFYDAAINDNSYASLASDILSTANDNGFDGINIYMDKANTATGAFGEPEKLKRFYEQIANTAPSTKIIDGDSYDYLLSLSVVGGWTRGSLAGVVNIPQFDWVNILAFGAEDTSPTAHSAQWYAEQEVGVWLGWQGPIVPSRIVLVVPAFGLRYFGVPANYTWANLWEYTQYISYADLCSTYADAPSKNIIENKPFVNADTQCDVIYYDGLPAIQSKATYALSTDIGGMGLWSVENDSKDASKSLMKQINISLGN